MITAPAMWRRSEVHRLVGANYEAVSSWERHGMFRSTVRPCGQGSRALLDRDALGGLAVLAALKNSGITFYGDELPCWDQLRWLARQSGLWLWLAKKREFIRWPAESLPYPGVGVLIDADLINSSLERRITDAG